MPGCTVLTVTPSCATSRALAIARLYSTPAYRRLLKQAPAHRRAAYPVGIRALMSSFPTSEEWRELKRKYDLRGSELNKRTLRGRMVQLFNDSTHLTWDRNASELTNMCTHLAQRMPAWMYRRPRANTRIECEVDRYLVEFDVTSAACLDLSADEFQARLEGQPLELRCDSVPWDRRPILLRGDSQGQMTPCAFFCDPHVGGLRRDIRGLFIEIIAALPRRVVRQYTFELAHATMSFLAWIRARYVIARHLLRRGIVVHPEWLLLDVRAECDRAGCPITPDFGRAVDNVPGPGPFIEILSATGATRLVPGCRRQVHFRSEFIGGPAWA